MPRAKRKSNVLNFPRSFGPARQLEPVTEIRLSDLLMFGIAKPALHRTANGWAISDTHSGTPKVIWWIERAEN
jgi:hypothetical protein